MPPKGWKKNGTEPEPIPPTPGPVVGPVLILPNPTPGQVLDMDDYPARQSKAYKAETERRAVTKPDGPKPTHKCLVCDQKFVSGLARPPCPWGCSYPFEKRTARGDHITTEKMA